MEQFIRKLVNKKSNIQFTKSYAIGNNVGPFDTDSNRFIQLYSKVGSIDGFLVRDNESEKFLNKFNYKGNFEKIYDVVFLKSYFPEIKEKIINDQMKTVGIVLMSWKQEGKKYLEKFDALRVRLREENINIKYFAYSELNDEVLKSYTHHEINIWKPNEMNVASYLDDFSQIDVCISMRFHGLVIANCMGIPSIGIGINNKIIDFGNQTKKANALVRDDFEVEDLVKILFEMKKTYCTILQDVKRYIDKFQNMEKLVENFMERIKKGNL